MSTYTLDRLSRRLGIRTLAGRLAWSGVVWIAAWALLLLAAFDVLFVHILAGQVDDALRARAEVVQQTIHVSGTDFRMDEPADDPALDAGTTVYAGTSVRDGRALPQDLVKLLVQRGEQTADREIAVPTRYLASPIMSKGVQIGTVVVSSDTGEFSRAKKVLLLFSAGFIAMLLLFTFFALRATVVRAMRPVRAMGEQAAAWSDRDLDRRFNPGAGPLELRQLATTLNALLDRISAALRHERQFTAELAHELRTPLAHLHAETDLMVQASNGDRPADEVTRMQTSILRLENLVESALAPARVQRISSPGVTHVNDLLAALPDAPAGLQLVVRNHLGVSIAVDQDQALRALTPVVENAFRFARSTIRISVTTTDGTAYIIVSDDGGRLDPGQTQMVFEPGVRLDPHDNHPGAGLGLALTRRICRALGGDAVASVRAGWTEFTLVLPAISRA